MMWESGKRTGEARVERWNGDQGTKSGEEDAGTIRRDRGISRGRLRPVWLGRGGGGGAMSAFCCSSTKCRLLMLMSVDLRSVILCVCTDCVVSVKPCMCLSPSRDQVVFLLVAAVISGLLICIDSLFVQPRFGAVIYSYRSRCQTKTGKDSVGIVH